MSSPRFARALALSILMTAPCWVPEAARAGGQGRDIPPYILPVAQTELRIASHARMVCVADPGTVCVAPYLDAPPNSTNTDGGTFRSASCPGGPPHGACRPDYVTGAELTGELIVNWPVTRLENIPNCGPSPIYEICENGHMELNVTAPGVSVANPLWELDSAKCDCIEPEFDPDSNFSGTGIDRWWRTRNKGASCDIALEYSWELVSRDQLLQIGQEAFPALLCDADADGACTIAPVPVLVEPDGSLTKGCGDPPSNTFLIRFAHPNEPVAFARKQHQAIGSSTGPRAVGDATGDGAADLVQGTLNLRVNDGNNRFSDQPTGLPVASQNDAILTDWTDDGDVDLVNGSTAGGVRVYPGDGAGGFDDAGSFLIDGSTSFWLDAEDLNGDDFPDVVSRGSTFTRVQWNPSGGPISPSVDTVSMTVDELVDLDADTDSDILGATSGSPVDVQWSSNGGPGGFGTPLTAVNVATAADALVPVLTQEIVDVLRCDPYASNCCSAHGGLGCDDAACADIVCNTSSSSAPFCCDTEWDDGCQAVALEECGVCMAAGTSDCCYEHGTTGCDLQACEDIVTTLEPGCASGAWDEFCAWRARGWCNECHASNVSCNASVQDVDGADVDADGDTDLLVSIGVDMTMIHSSPSSDYEAFAGYVAWIPNLQGGGATPVFDTGIEPWRLLGPAAGGQIEMIDLDDDTLPDAVGVGFWYRNVGGSFTGPHALGLGSVAQGCGVDGLVGYWRLNGGAADTSCGNDGTVSGATPVSDLDGTPNSAYAFDGADDFIDLGTANELKPELPLTISMWVRHSCPAATVCDLIHNDVNLGIFSGVRLYIDGTGVLGARYGDGGGGGSNNRRLATATTPVGTGAWHHVALVINSALNFDFYIDGVLDGVTYSGTGGALAYTGADVSLGGGAYGQPYSGDLDEIALYDRALGQEEVQALRGPGQPIATRLSDPTESLKRSTLLVADLDGDADLDVVGQSQLWERVEPLPEPGATLALAAGIVALGLLRRRRAALRPDRH